MFSFPHALKILRDEGLLSTIPAELIVGAPLYVQHHDESEIAMPNRQAWSRFQVSSDFQRILPAPITKSLQTAKSLRGFRIYSILISDGGTLLTMKILASETGLLLINQAFEIDETLAAVTKEGQPLKVRNKCYVVRPDFRQVSEFEPPMPEMVRILSISTMHFLYSLHVDRERYRKA